VGIFTLSDRQLDMVSANKFFDPKPELFQFLDLFEPPLGEISKRLEKPAGIGICAIEGRPAEESVRRLGMVSGQVLSGTEKKGSRQTLT